MQNGKAQDALDEILTELVLYTKIHFVDEETLMQTYSFPDLENHKAMHQELLLKVSDFCDKFNRGSFGIPLELCDFLQDWLKVHIAQEDKQYGQFIASQTVAVK